jgi:putative endonuclease
MVTRQRKFGDIGEEKAAEFLRTSGYIIVERNFLVREGEIDLIAEKDDELVFVEVKTRKNTTFGEIAESVTPVKQQRCVLASQRYMLLKNIPEETPWRMDVITVDFARNPPAIEHFQNAFE